MGFSALAALAVVTTAVSLDAQRSAANKSEDARKLQEKSNQELKAQNAQQAADERRAQIREERVKRARIIQASENTGTAGSSGEFGAVSGLQTQLSTNVGSNLSRIQTANTVTDLQQQAANLQFSAQSTLQRGQQAQQVLQLGTSIFGAWQSNKLANAKLNSANNGVNFNQ